MYLRKLKISHFRRIKDLEIDFSKGVNIILGENNSGKTTIIDALRTLLVHGPEDIRLTITEDDFTDGFSPKKPIEIGCVFSSLTDEEEIQLYEALVLTTDGFEAHLHARFEFNEKTGRPRSKWWCGETEGNNVPFNLFEYISCIYLPPLRDPARGLRPGRRSQLSRLVRHLSTEDDRDEFVKIAENANKDMLHLDPIKVAKTTVNTAMGTITGQTLKQDADLAFVDPNFDRLVSALRPIVEGLSIEQNGLGYNNLLYTATTMGTLQRDSELAYRGILIEEPEAHLHPQLQTLLLRYLKATEGKKDAPVQVIMTSHSPTFASQAEVDSVISLYESSSEVRAISIGSLELETTTKRKLERYLDATKAELFFARKIIMVEGLSEAILLPVLAQNLDPSVDLREEAITIINTNGLNFDMFMPLFVNGAIDIPVAVITDGDPGGDCYPAPEDTPDVSSHTLKLKAQEGGRLTVFHAKKTLEYDLALEGENLPVMVAAYKEMHPKLGKILEEELKSVADVQGRAKKFFIFLFETENRRTSKPEFAETLSALISDSKHRFAVPKYLQDALRHVLKDGETDESVVTEAS